MYCHDQCLALTSHIPGNMNRVGSALSFESRSLAVIDVLNYWNAFILVCPEDEQYFCKHRKYIFCNFITTKTNSTEVCKKCVLSSGNNGPNMLLSP